MGGIGQESLSHSVDSILLSVSQDEVNDNKLGNLQLDDILKQEGLLGMPVGYHELAGTEEVFSLDDPIFSLKAPVKERTDLPAQECPECSKPITKSIKKIWYSVRAHLLANSVAESLASPA